MTTTPYGGFICKSVNEGLVGHLHSNEPFPGKRSTPRSSTAPNKSQSSYAVPSSCRPGPNPFPGYWTGRAVRVLPGGLRRTSHLGTRRGSVSCPPTPLVPCSCSFLLPYSSDKSYHTVSHPFLLWVSFSKSRSAKFDHHKK